MVVCGRLPERLVAVAFATDSDIVRGHRLSRADAWCEWLMQTRHVAPRLDGCRHLPERLVVRAAPSFLLNPVSGERWLAVGDAAATYDPLSSQGICSALAGGVAAAEAVVAAANSDAQAIFRYADAVVARFEQYRANRNYFYGAETRWPDAPFWARRRARAQVRLAAG